ncbi:uncharacterized protein LOC122855614 isoform X2 [Aphidius gifuensis]|uniref:uncharacterized protein LOC122855614 isoform X2 n=1 Tax=Aphidius gifuensis TaxID=684658 RepID=UPI001CDCE0B8|nr:uncharacterized protein LOC122855614 isoform X2 [Aphidius gifuensis]
MMDIIIIETWIFLKDFQLSRVGDSTFFIPDPFDGVCYRSLNDTLQAFTVVLTEWYQNACIVTSAVMSDIKTLWIITNESYIKKLKTVGNLVFYYLIVLAIYIIETGFWINKKIIQLLTTIVINSNGNTQATIGLCIFIGFMIIAFLLGGLINSSTSSSSC